MTSKIAVISLAGLLLVSVVPVLATEVTGELDTGVGGSGVEGVLITTPAASPAAGDYSSSQSVTLTATGSTSIHYTTNGTDPTCTTGTTYPGAISVTSDTTIEALSCYANGNASSVVSLTYDISSSGGGGGGSGAPKTTTPTVPVSQMTLPQLQAELARLIALLAQLQAAGAAPGVAPAVCSAAFNTNLSYGMINNSEVVRLQEFLISKGHLAAGYNTGRYYSLTANAVGAYQTSKGISPVPNSFGPLTRAAANADCGF